MLERKPKILYLITKSNLGGAQKYVLELATEAKQRDFSVVVACGGTGEKRAGLGPLAAACEAAGITVRPIKHFMRDMSLWRDVAAFFEVLRIIRQERPEILHVTSSKAGGIGGLAGRLLRVPRIIFTSHGLTMDETWRPRWQQWLITFFTWLTLRLAHHSIMISTETYDRAQALPGLSRRISLIFNGVKPVSLLSRAEARQTLVPTLSAKQFVIGGVGELHPNKNWHSLINAVPKLPTNVSVLIIGEGEERRSLAEQVTKLNLENRVHLAGYHNAAPLLKAFDIFVLPSKKEGLPYVLLEAALAELPIVASDLPGNRDIIIGGETGLLVSPEPNTLAASLQMLINDGGMRTVYGQRAKQYVTETFSIDTMFHKTFALYSGSSRVPV